MLIFIKKFSSNKNIYKLALIRSQILIQHDHHKFYNISFVLGFRLQMKKYSFFPIRFQVHISEYDALLLKHRKIPRT